jgi:hypothetical protein
MDHLDSGNGAYPDSTTDVVKLLRELKFEVTYDERPESRSLVAHNAADFWMPVLAFTDQMSWSVIGGVLANLLTSLLGNAKASRAQLHLKVGRTGRDGETSYFEGSGPASQVLKALENFEDHD